MESCVKPESRNIVGTCRRKRKLEDEEQGESSSMAGSSSMDEECEITSTKSKEDSTKRKSFLRSSLSKECISTSTTEEDNEDSDKSYSSKWQCVDLKNINIFYCDKPQPLEELMQIVKEDLFKKYPNSKDVEKTVQKFTKLTKENMLVSFDLDIIRQERKKSRPVKYLYEKRVHERIESDMEKAKKADSDLEHNDLFDRKWFLAVEMFLFTTVKLVKRMLYPSDDHETVKQAKESIKRKTRKKTGKDKKLAEKCEPSESVYQHFFSMFGRLFFLEHCEVDKRTFVIGDKIVKSTPDLAYCTRQVVVGDNIDDTKTLLFVVEVKVKQIKNVTTNRLEELVDSGVLGQVGSVLFAEAFYSCLFPNSLGIMCMETKLIFVYLIMPEEHIDSIMCCEKPLKTEGKIHFTKPYDMLKAEDRAEVCEFLYWLGCFQNQGRWSLMSTERTQFKD
uniref:Uncharacterized protein LOC111135292 isoform X1 n=1 Tax=Crassostrea virginica TaxID=6565 RepID=A0A8B8EM12_CRAVI|nr:uncharacterized protein LOC111135292 isoform X1 [Crassostrea virginica]